MKPWIVASVASGVVAALTIGLLGNGRCSPNDANPPASSSNAAAEELKALRAEIELLKRRAAAAPVEHAPAAPVASIQVPAVEAERTGAEDRERDAKERARQAMTDLEARVASERVDSEWSLRTVRAIRDVIGRVGAGSKTVEAECASSLCRILVSHDTEEAHKLFASKVAAEEPFRSGVAYDYDFDSTPRKTTLFVLREGSSFDPGDRSP
jgi:hypothetical protein